MSLYGMDLAQGEHFARELTRASQRFAQLSKQLTPVIAAAPWRGPDGDQFRGDWRAHSRMLQAAAETLRVASEAVRDNVRQQDDASSGHAGAGTPGGNTVGTVLDGLLSAAGEMAGTLWDGTGEFIDTTVGGLSDGLDWLQHQASGAVSNLGDAGGDLFGRVGDLGGLGWDFLSTGEPPSITELIAGSAGVMAASSNATIALATGGFVHPHILDDGSPVAGQPQTVGVGSDPARDGHRSTPLPSSLAQIMGGVTAAYDDGGKNGTPDAAVRITTVDKGNGPAYIVTIPGTSEWNVTSGTNPMDTVGNLSSAGGNLSTASQAVELAMQQAGIPSDAPVMLVGHSQGGMTAANLAADPEFRDSFNVTNVLTYGSPIDSTHVPAGVHTLALQHQFDVVPRLDLGNSKPGGPLPVPWASSSNATVVTLPSPPGSGAGDIVGNHDFNAYVTSVDANEQSGALADYRNDPATQAFITDDPGQVRSTTSGISREE